MHGRSRVRVGLGERVPAHNHIGGSDWNMLFCLSSVAEPRHLSIPRAPSCGGTVGSDERKLRSAPAVTRWKSLSSNSWTTYPMKSNPTLLDGSIETSMGNTSR